MSIAEMNIACALNHIETLRKHGAQVLGPDGQRMELNSFFYDKAKDECWLNIYEAICYELFLPDIEDRLLIAIHKDGRVDTGSEKNVIMCLDR